MIRRLACAVCFGLAGVGLAACGPIAPAEWAAIGAIAGASGAALTFDDDLLRVFVGGTAAPLPAAP
jgi:hypothetical protein